MEPQETNKNTDPNNITPQNTEPTVILSNQPSFNQAITPPRRSLSRRQIISVITVFSVLVIFAGIWLVTSSGNNENNTNTAQESSASDQKQISQATEQDGQVDNQDSPDTNQDGDTSASSGSGSDGQNQNSGNGSEPNNPTTSNPAPCGVENMPSGVCVAITSIETQGIKNNPYVKKDTSVFPESVTVDVRQQDWTKTEANRGVVFYSAKHEGNSYNGQLYFEKSTEGWFVVDYTVSAA